MRFNLIFGIVWMLLFINKSSAFNQLKWFDLFWMLISILYFGMFIYQKRYDYFVVENNMIRLNGPLGKKIHVNHITKVNYFAGEYVVHYLNKKAKISIASLDEDTKKQLKDFIDHLHIGSA